MRLLFIGDVVGVSGQQALRQLLPQLKQTYRPQIIVVNGENIADGRGITEKLYKFLLSMDVNCVTLGNHAWDNKDIYNFIDNANCLVRPLNLSDSAPGKGVHYIRFNKIEIAIVNAVGNVYMDRSLDVFQTLHDTIERIRQRTSLIFVDFHAEATSEKQGLAYLLDGKVSAVIGTHTHVQTNDATISDKGTAYMTDVGMTGAKDSIIGFSTEVVMKRFLTHMPVRLEQAVTNHVMLNAVLLDMDCKTGKTTAITPISLTEKIAARYY